MIGEGVCVRSGEGVGGGAKGMGAGVKEVLPWGCSGFRPGDRCVRGIS